MTGRPREFDVDEALDAVTAAFWERGFEATSLADLMQATGLQKGSIYKAFGDKHTLFVRVLDRYLTDGLEQIREAIETPESPRAGLRAWLARMIEVCCDQDSPRGCFGINTLVELGPHDAEVAARFKLHFKRLGRVVARAVQRGQELREFRQDQSAATLVEFLMAVVSGLLTASKGALPRAQAQRVVGFTLGALDAPAG